MIQTSVEKDIYVYVLMCSLNFLDSLVLYFYGTELDCSWNVFNIICISRDGCVMFVLLFQGWFFPSKDFYDIVDVRIVSFITGSGNILFERSKLESCCL